MLLLRELEGLAEHLCLRWILLVDGKARVEDFLWNIKMREYGTQVLLRCYSDSLNSRLDNADDNFFVSRRVYHPLCELTVFIHCLATLLSHLVYLLLLLHHLLFVDV